MDETYYPRSQRSVLDLLAQFVNQLADTERSPLLEDWGVVLAGPTATPRDFWGLAIDRRTELLKVLRHAGAAASGIEIVSSRVPHIVLAWDNVIALPSDEPPTTTGEIPVIR